MVTGGSEPRGVGVAHVNVQDPRGSSRKIQIGGASTAPGDPSSDAALFRKSWVARRRKTPPGTPCNQLPNSIPIGAILARTEANPGRHRMTPGNRRSSSASKAIPVAAASKRGHRGLGRAFRPGTLAGRGLWLHRRIRQSMPSSVYKRARQLPVGCVCDGVVHSRTSGV